jgi:hemerythrin-like domain-containing protein
MLSLQHRQWSRNCFEIAGGISMARRRGSGGTNWTLWGGLIAGGASLIPFIPMIRRRAMRVTTILKKDHRMVSGLVMTLEMTPKFNGTVRKSLFNQIYTNLMAHATAEEEVFYPAVRNIAFGQAHDVDEAYRGHGIVKDLLRHMSDLDPIGDEFDTKLAELKTNIQHHVEEEEGELFELCESRMSQEQLFEIGQALSERKKELKMQRAA